MRYTVVKLASNFTKLRMARALGVLLSLHLSTHHHITNQALQCKFIDISKLSTRFRFFGKLLRFQQDSLVPRWKERLDNIALKQTKKNQRINQQKHRHNRALTTCSGSKYKGS